MSVILSIETATTVCSVAIAKDGKVLAMREQNNGYSHAERVSPFIREILEELGMTVNDLDAVAVSLGPGSYTGLRIGVSTAKGLCFAQGIPLIAVSSIQAMAWDAAEKHTDFDLYVPMIDARRMEVYSAEFDVTNRLVADTRAEIIDQDSYARILKDKRVLLCGDGSSKCKGVITSDNCVIDDAVLPSARSMAHIAHIMYEKEDFVDTAYFEPYYLKDFIAGVPKVKGLR